MKGIYRVSGNKADVESVHQKFEEDPNKDFSEYGITVHAATSALKSFFTKLPVALIPSTNYDGIISATSEFRLKPLVYTGGGYPAKNAGGRKLKNFLRGCHSCR